MLKPTIDPTVGYWDDSEPPQYRWTDEETTSIRLAVEDLMEHLTVRIGWTDEQAIKQGRFYLAQVHPGHSHHLVLNRILNAYERKL